MLTFKRTNRWNTSRGVALVTVLLFLMMLSAVAVGLMYTVNTEQHLQRTDQGNGLAYYSAEAGMEKMMADLNDLYLQQASPTAAGIEAVACPGGGGCANAPDPAALNGSTFPEYQITVPRAADGVNAACSPSTVSSGSNQGLIASICPMTLAVTAIRPGGEDVRLIRNVEVALIPVFQFGVFSDSDLSFFAGPPMDFNGRVHTNGNLFLAEGNGAGPPPSILTFFTAVRAALDVSRDRLANGRDINITGHTGPVRIATGTGGCAPPAPAATCRPLSFNAPYEGSSQFGTLTPPGIPTAGGVANPGWTGISKTTYNGMIRNGLTGATPLNLPFVQGGVNPIEIIRRPLVGDAPLTATSRLYNKAQIRVMLSDDPLELSPGGAADANNIRLANVGPYAAGVNAGGGQVTFFAQENPAIDANWSNRGATFLGPPPAVTQNLIDGWLRVEYRNAAGVYLPITQTWLNLGWARGTAMPDSEHGVVNNINPNAILLFQKLRNGIGWTGQRTDFYPINMYDVREGNFRDIDDSVCRVNGVMSIVEIDVRALKNWITAFGLVENLSQNGYVLYYSDRRGMLPDPNPPAPAAPNTKTGAYGFDDVVNLGAADGTPNGGLDQGEGANPAGLVNTWGRLNIGQGIGLNPNGPGAGPFSQPNTQVPSVPAAPYNAANACARARVNWVSGARHAVRLVNGSLNNLPLRPNADPNNNGGFTLASENPAYVVGNYNANDAAGFGDPHASAAVLADTVTLLSRQWSDDTSFAFPTTVANNRPAITSSFRLAIASGKNRNFSWAATANLPAGGRPSDDFGTDGGVHNFLRYLEDWSPAAGTQTFNYTGSMVNLYYSAYATGVFKCCTTVYNPPRRAYTFDTDFQDLTKIPPGTPRFQDVVNVGFRQDFSNR